MAEHVDVILRKVVPADAKKLSSALQIIGSETPYLIIDEKGLEMTIDELEESIEQLYNSQNNVVLVALLDGDIIGTASVKASLKQRMEHIGEVGISVLKEYWGLGLGSLLMEEVILWAKESQVIRRLELTVQKRNTRAIHLYEKMGFQTEAIMTRGAKTDDGDFLDVALMSRMID